jgi:hypothetical protein
MANRVRFVQLPNVNPVSEQQFLVALEREALRGLKVSLAQQVPMDRRGRRENEELRVKLEPKEYKDCKDVKETSDLKEQRGQMEVLLDSGK